MIIRKINKNEIFTITFNEKLSSGYKWFTNKTNEIEFIGSKINDLSLGCNEYGHDSANNVIQTIFYFKSNIIGTFLVKFFRKRPWEINTPTKTTYEEMIDII